jgi:phosphate starvation-inducible PhoH-like protein
LSEAHTRKIYLNLEEDPSWLYGRGDEVLRYLEEVSGVGITGRGAQLHLVGEEHRVDSVEDFIRQMEKLHREGKVSGSKDIRFAARTFFAEERATDLGHLMQETVLVAHSKKPISPKTPTQRRYVQAIHRHDIVFGIGPAGTGKTYLAVAMAVASLLKREVNRIILTRPAVEAGERLGFLPGDLYEKIHPYLRPLYDALYEMIEAEKVNRMVERGTIEIAPLAFMRGRTLNDSFIILDEAQNTTTEQMMMFLTRLGFDSKAVITGDVTQIDLPAGRQSGLVEAQEVITGIEGIEFVTFTEKDVVRHDLVKKIIRAYETRTRGAARRGAGGRESDGNQEPPAQGTG